MDKYDTPEKKIAALKTANIEDAKALDREREATAAYRAADLKSAIKAQGHDPANGPADARTIAAAKAEVASRHGERYQVEDKAAEARKDGVEHQTRLRNRQIDKLK